MMTPKWMEEQPKLKQCLLDIVLSFKRCQCDESNDTSLQILDFAEKMVQYFQLTALCSSHNP